MKCAGALGRENVGMSNRKSGERPDRRKPKVSSAMAIIGGLGVPKDNPSPVFVILQGAIYDRENWGGGSRWTAG